MNCKCKILNIGPFKTEQNFLEFKSKMITLVNESVLSKFCELDHNSPFLSYEYHCLKCRKKWILNIPDHAYRGGWIEKS